MLPSMPLSAWPYWDIKDKEEAGELLDDVIELIIAGRGLELRKGEEEEIVVFSAYPPEFPNYLVMMGLSTSRAIEFDGIRMSYLHFTAPAGTWSRLKDMVEIGGCVWW